MISINVELLLVRLSSDTITATLDVLFTALKGATANKIGPFE
jgi:hypothetical protein